LGVAAAREVDAGALAEVVQQIGEAVVLLGVQVGNPTPLLHLLLLEALDFLKVAFDLALLVLRVGDGLLGVRQRLWLLGRTTKFR
jgi:hypothetical protein